MTPHLDRISDSFLETSNPPLVLIVEDDPDLRELLSEQLEADGFRVAVIGDGAMALDYLTTALHSNSEVDLPAVVVCDLALPGSSGFEILSEILELTDLDVIAMTAYGDPHVHTRARQLGATLSLDKPLDMMSLRAAVHVLAARA